MIFLVRENIIKAAMNLIDADRAEHLYSVMGARDRSIWWKCGKHGRRHRKFGWEGGLFLVKWLMITWAEFSPMISAQLVFILKQKPLVAPPPTARSMIFVTPDGGADDEYLSGCLR